MPPAARVGDLHTCPMVTGIVPHVGGPVLPSGCPTVLIGLMPAARVGDLATCVGPPDAIAQGSPTVLIGNRPAARLGDNTAHGGVIVAGCPTVIIGEQGAPASALARAISRLRSEVAGSNRPAKAAVATSISYLGSEMKKGFLEGVKPGEVLKNIVGSPQNFAGFLVNNPTTVRGAANLIKLAGISADVNAAARKMGDFLKPLDSPPGAAVAGFVISPVVQFASRCIQGKRLFSKAALFDYATSAAEGALSGAIAGAIAGSVLPGPGTLIGFAGGLAVGIAASVLVHTAAKPAEDWGRQKLGIRDKD